MKRYPSVPDADHHVEAGYRVAEQVEQDRLYQETGAALDLLETAQRIARRSEDVADETRAALMRAELALDDALDSRAESVATDAQEWLDDVVVEVS